MSPEPGTIHIDRSPIGFTVEQTKTTIRDNGLKGTRIGGAERIGKGAFYPARTLRLT